MQDASCFFDGLFMQCLTTDAKRMKKKTAPNNNSDNNSGSNDIEHEEIWLEYMNIRQTKRVEERKKMH